MQIIEKPISELRPYEGNAKKHTQTQIENVARSIKRYGFVQPVVVDADGVIVIGHCRALAAQRLGMETVPCVSVDDLTPKQVKELRILDNKTNESEWDKGLLLTELVGLDLSDFSLDFALPEPDIEVQEDEVPEISPLAPTEAQRGAIWRCGMHYVMCGDATLQTDVDRLMSGRKADLLLTDPPYNVNYQTPAGKIVNDALPDEEFRAFLRDAFTVAKTALLPGAGFYIWHADIEGLNFRGACREAGLRVRQCLIWVKDSLVLGRQDYHWIHEPCLTGDVEGAEDADRGETHDPCLYGWNEGAAHTWRGDRKQTTVLHFARPRKSEDHPTMKPVKLCAYLIKNSTSLGGLVVDFFGGSGSTLIACEQIGRECRIMDVDPRYVDMIVRRWEKWTGLKAERVC